MLSGKASSPSSQSTTAKSHITPMSARPLKRTCGTISGRSARKGSHSSSFRIDCTADSRLGKRSNRSSPRRYSALSVPEDSRRRIGSPAHRGTCSTTSRRATASSEKMFASIRALRAPNKTSGLRMAWGFWSSCKTPNAVDAGCIGEDWQRSRGPKDRASRPREVLLGALNAGLQIRRRDMRPLKRQSDNCKVQRKAARDLTRSGFSWNHAPILRPEDRSRFPVRYTE